jgi:hypothetical protein
VAETPSGVDVPGLIPNVADGAGGGGVARPNEETISRYYYEGGEHRK